jgi:hypothetical protein
VLDNTSLGGAFHGDGPRESGGGDGGRARAVIIIADQAAALRPLGFGVIGACFALVIVIYPDIAQGRQGPVWVGIGWGERLCER